jgi:ankyrin repeat protein
MKRPTQPSTPADQLCAAAQYGDLAAITRLLDSGVVTADSTGGMNDLAPLEHAANYNQLEASRLLLDRGAKAGADSALQTCAHKGRVELARLLIDRGADWKCKNVNQQNAKDIAVEYHNHEVAALFK